MTPPQRQPLAASLCLAFATGAFLSSAHAQTASETPLPPTLPAVVVTATKQNDRGTVTHVLYEHPGQTHLEQAKEATISSWQGWAKQDAMVVREGAV